MASGHVNCYTHLGKGLSLHDRVKHAYCQGRAIPFVGVHSIETFAYVYWETSSVTFYSSSICNNKRINIPSAHLQRNVYINYGAFVQ